MKQRSCNDCTHQAVCVYEKLMYEFAVKICKRCRSSGGEPWLEDLFRMRQMLASSCESYIDCKRHYETTDELWLEDLLRD